MITFPTTTEAFIAYQEAGIHRELNEFERKLAEVVVELANGSYQEGVEGTENSVTIKYAQEIFRKRGEETNEKILRIWESVCWWCDRAYIAGEETRRETW